MGLLRHGATPASIKVRKGNRKGGGHRQVASATMRAATTVPARLPMTSPALPPRPEAPLPSDCRGSGCSPCIFELHEQELQRWWEEVAAIRQAAAERSTPPPSST